MSRIALKTIIINCAVFLVLLLIIELVLGQWFVNYTGQIDRDTDFDAKTIKNYFPEIIHFIDLDSIDGGGRIYSYINKSRIRVQNEDLIKTYTNFADYDIINIGDSFLQADEIPFSKTLSAVMEDNLNIKILQVGFSSWAPINMLKWLEDKELRKGVHVNIFVMINDFNPYDYWCNFSYHSRLKGDSTYNKSSDRKNVFLTLWSQIAKRSFFYNKIRTLWHSLESTEIFNMRILNTHPNCELLREIENSHIESLTKGYAGFAFDSSCWNVFTKNVVDNAIIDINKIVDIVQSRGGSSTVYLVPAGWSFEGECRVGKSTDYYKMSENTRITSKGLSQYLQKHVRSPFVALEKVISEMKIGDSSKWYLPFEGHWNVHANQMLGIWMANTMKTPITN